MAPSKTIPWRKDIFTPAFTGLLDQSFASGATAAYSLRRLKISATKAVRVREDSGNTETDIGFSGGTLDTTALLNHVGSNNGFVTKWYDQSGNGNDASNSTASEQPQIANSGTVIKENGKPAIEFDGSDDFLESQNITVTAENFTYITVLNRTTGSPFSFGGFLADGILIQVRGPDNNEFKYLPNQASATTDFAITNNKQLLIENYDNATDTEQYFNNNKNNVNGDLSLSGATHPFSIGFRRDSGGEFFGGTKQEVLIYFDDRLSGRTGFKNNINNHYSIF